MSKFNVLKVAFDNITLNECLAGVSKFLQGDEKRTIFFLNADCLRISERDDVYRDSLQNADMLLPDGIALKLITRVYGGKLLANLNGTDLSPQIIEMGASLGKSVFFLGGQPGVAKAAAKNAVKQFPNLKIAGCADGFFEDDLSIVNKVNESGADILFVAMGVPRQERWISEYRTQLNPGLCLGVGAFLDYLSETIPRAPLWMRKMNVEWLWRIYVEPRRMFKRYIVDGIAFVGKVILIRHLS